MHIFAPLLSIIFLALPVGLLGILAFIFWIWMLIDAIQNPRLSGNERIVWVLVIIFVPFLGPIIYFFAGRGR